MSLYDQLRHFADSYALGAMMVLFLLLALWPFRPGAGRRNRDAATMIFKDDSDGE